MAHIGHTYKNVLVVIKQTAYGTYQMLKSQGKAPVAVRWDRLRNRNDKHQQCVDKVVELIKSSGTNFSIIGREDMHRGLLVDKDLVVAVGGDGTILNCASFLGSDIPLLGINSDPTPKHERGLINKADERRSTGELCASTAENLDQMLPLILCGDYVKPSLRRRIQCLVQSTYKTTRLPPALNDLLLANPIPAGVSRFRLGKMSATATGFFNNGVREDYGPRTQYSINAWSSGMWVCTPTGSTAAMKAAGGVVQATSSSDMQYMVREHLVEQGASQNLDLGHGFLSEEEMLFIRWNSQYGAVFADGAHMKHDLELGDELAIDLNAPGLQLFERSPDIDS